MYNEFIVQNNTKRIQREKKDRQKSSLNHSERNTSFIPPTRPFPDFPRLSYQLSLPSSKHLPPSEPNNTEPRRLTIEGAVDDDWKKSCAEILSAIRDTPRPLYSSLRRRFPTAREKEKEKEGREKRKGEKVEKNRLIRPIVRSVGAPGPGRLINGHVRLINGVSATNHGEAAATGINTNYTRVAGRAPEAAKGSRGVP